MLRNSTTSALKFDFSDSLFPFPSSHNGWFQEYSLKISSHNLLPGEYNLTTFYKCYLSVHLCISPKIRSYTGCLILQNVLQPPSICICCKYCTNLCNKSQKMQRSNKMDTVCYLLGNDSLLSKNTSCSYI